MSPEGQSVHNLLDLGACLGIRVCATLAHMACSHQASPYALALCVLLGLQSKGIMSLFSIYDPDAYLYIHIYYVHVQ